MSTNDCYLLSKHNFRDNGISPDTAYQEYNVNLNQNNKCENNLKLVKLKNEISENDRQGNGKLQGCSLKC